LPALKHLDLQDTIYVVTIYDDQELIGLFPVCIKSGGLRVRYISIWKFKDCCLTDPLYIRDSLPFYIFTHLMERLNAHAVISATHTNYELGSDAQNKSYRFRRSRGAITDFIGWNSYADGLNSKHRSENKRVMSRLLNQKDVSYITSDTALSSKWLPLFIHLDSNSMKGKEGRAIEQDKERLEYFTETIRLGERAKKIKFQILQKGPEVLAMSFRYITRNSTYEIKTTFNVKYKKQYPGIVLELLSIKDILNSGYDLADSCATPHNPVINRIWPNRRDIFRTVIFRKSLIGKFANVLYKIRREPDKDNTSID
jgi:hypothetical protein